MFLRKKSLVSVLILAMVVALLAACGNENSSEDENQSSNVDYASQVTENPIVTITMENDEKIIVELEPKVAPNTVANFIALVKDGFYDGLIFHRVIPGFMVQGGDPDGTGMGGPDYSIKGEFSSNGFENTLAHERGVLSMARSKDPDSAGSQFFIMVEEATHLDGDYAAFGKVIEGMDVVDKVVAVERDGSDKPLEEQKMKTVEVDTKGFDYPEPVVQK
ncbi:peptidylprolyl isomerase [Lysinibacillus sp. 2017]|uniref:peptidylprolyl isomerase n=1 Tax=unclassified Lysinibacillus TaxID=2636778 RepID=UPI000D529E41|nr:MULTISPECIES: peptidylprolyl isomerase [unclassified Lysinibacillus]AWE09141.1 peptidylprolyl isomerase [Lysinibacillus sp. 2017]TGN35966.1 peptidylprolyl isomerase [Lysinibacillus sp. S2017]